MGIVKSGLFGLAALMGLVSCGNQEEILPGERLNLRPGTDAAVNRAVPIKLARSTNHISWTHRAGSVTHRLQHPAFTTNPTQVWAADIGQGNDRRHRISADPVAANGRVFTLDSRAGVTATATSGSLIWSRDLTPTTDKADDASGGGLAIVDGQLYVTTGFGDLTALNATDGSVIWQQRLDAPATGAPTVSGGLVYVVTRDSRAWAIDATTGLVRWQLGSPPSPSGVIGGAAPAVGAGLVYLPFGTGQLAGAFPKGGLQVWKSSIAGSRPGKAYAQLSDVSADPVVHGKRIYVGNPSGRTLAIDASNGDIIWAANEGATGPVWVDGGSLFLLSDQGELVRLKASNGSRIWGTQLPSKEIGRQARRQTGVFAHYGPVLAGGQLWVASSNGQLRAFDPVDGHQTFATELLGGASTRPIVVQGVMYVVSGNGQLLAFR